jgi:hypothetical protein
MKQQGAMGVGFIILIVVLGYCGSPWQLADDELQQFSHA